MTASVALIGLRLNCQCACKHGSLAEIHFRATVTPAGWRGLNPFTPRRDRRLSALHMKCLPPPYYLFPGGVRVHPSPPPFPARASVAITWGLIQTPTRVVCLFSFSDDPNQQNTDRVRRRRLRQADASTAGRYAASFTLSRYSFFVSERVDRHIQTNVSWQGLKKKRLNR